MAEDRVNDCRVVSTRHGVDDASEWMTENAATDLAEDMGGHGVYDAVRLEFRPA